MTINEAALASLNARQNIIRDRVTGVAKFGQNAFFLHGRPGTSKTYTVTQTLDDLSMKYAREKGHITPIGLFNLFENNADRIIVLDDVNSVIFNQPIGMSILLAALGNDRKGRYIKHSTSKGTREVLFTGGLIAISNLCQNGSPVLDAIRSRVQPFEYDPTDEEIMAFCRAWFKAAGLIRTMDSALAGTKPTRCWTSCWRHAGMSAFGQKSECSVIKPLWITASGSGREHSAIGRSW